MNAGPNVQPNRERRTWPRQCIGPGTPVIATIGMSPHCALVHDLSLAGLCLMTTHPLPIGATVPVSIARPNSGQTHLLVVAILRCDPAENGLLCIAGRFTDAASEAVARELLADFPSGEGSEPRPESPA